jgi:hypothetical protein
MAGKTGGPTRLGELLVLSVQNTLETFGSW